MVAKTWEWELVIEDNRPYLIYMGLECIDIITDVKDVSWN